MLGRTPGTIEGWTAPVQGRRMGGVVEEAGVLGVGDGKHRKRERIEHDRLQAVCEHVRRWLFADAADKPGKPTLRLHAETGASCAGCSDDAGKEGVA